MRMGFAVLLHVRRTRAPPLLPSMMSILLDVIAAAACMNIFFASFRVGQRRRVLGRERGRYGLNTQRHLNARRTESARTYSGTRIGAQPLNMKRRYLRLPPTKNPRGLRERVDVRMCPKSMWKLAMKNLTMHSNATCCLQ